MKIYVIYVKIYLNLKLFTSSLPLGQLNLPRCETAQQVVPSVKLNN